MGLRYEHLDDITRKFMVDEIAMDERDDRLYRSPWLSQKGQGDWAELLSEAARVGTDDTLAQAIHLQRRLNTHGQRKKPNGFGYTSYRVPHTAGMTIAEGEFNRYYVRGLCRRAVEEKKPYLEVYRAKIVAEPRPESSRKIGMLMDPTALLADLRIHNGIETALGMPQGPNSGLTLRFPRALTQP